MSDIIVMGGAVVDRYFIVERFPKRGQDGCVLDSFEQIGGCALNIAVAVRNMGGCAHVVSYLGDDSYGRKILSYMREKKLSDACIRTRAAQTGYCLVFVEPDGERTFLTKEGCEGKFEETLLPLEIIRRSKTLIITGYYLLDSTAGAMLEAARKMKESGLRIIFDPGPLADKIDGAILKEILHLSDIVTPNRSEAAVLDEKAYGWREKLCGRGGILIQKDGSRGGIIYEGRSSFSYEAVAVDAVDTTGAGDSFVGAFACMLDRGWDVKQCAAAAALCAAKTTQVRGPHGDFNLNF